MQFTKRYNLINNVTGWGVFLIALVTYWLTLEPTVSYWDCGEFISQADKLEIGHPPGNPIFMLTARFFSNFAFGDASKVALMVNAMSGLLSALTILLLFWTITHLATRLLVRNHDTATMSTAKYLAVMGSGVVGALAYTWSDTFWFSAVEGEVYAFSSFCTALVFWLILKWENRADQPHSDRYLILIAYVIGVSIAVHLLNLLCIPAIVLVFAYKKWKNLNATKSLIALAVSFAIIVLVLFGLVPGFIKVAGWFELLAVNTFGMPFNAGVIIYTILTVGCFVWALRELYVQRSAQKIRISFCLGVLLSGILFIGHSFWPGAILFAALLYFVWGFFRKKLPVRWLNLVMWSIAVIFIGYSSYALILIRAHANPPLNQSAPDNVFALSGYLNREQYGDVPLLYGPTYQSSYYYDFSDYGEIDIDGEGTTAAYPDYTMRFKKGDRKLAKGVKGAVPVSYHDYLSADERASNASHARRGGDYYVTADYNAESEYTPSMNMLMPRIHSHVPSHKQQYELWVPSLGSPEHEKTEIMAYNKTTKKDEPMIELSSESLKYNEYTGEYNFTNTMKAVKPTFMENLEFFFSYQLNHMYWRYFLWNFAGRQNDMNNQQGEKDLGNWITGYPFLDNPRLGDQSLLPDDLGKDNPGHNVFYCLPLILGLLGLFWQAFKGRTGIQQFWVVFFLFFMTGIAIVLYLNQPPLQPRERDYAFAGSFYAFAIWIGLGVAALWRGILRLLDYIDKNNAKKPGATTAAGKGAVAPATAAATGAAAPGAVAPVAPATAEGGKKRAQRSLYAAIAACALGIIVPLQMVSQTWDDHDRSGRYAALDFARNYLESLEPNAILFCNGDNDTFPLWYAQEVEGVRPDVKVVNLSYLQSDWYANQQRLMTNKAPGIKFTATPADIAYGRREMVIVNTGTDTTKPTDLISALKAIYSPAAKGNVYGYVDVPFANTYIPVDRAAVMKRGLYNPEYPDMIEDFIPVDFSQISGGQVSQSQLMMLDIIATNAANGWERPIYWAGTVGAENYTMFAPYVRMVGMNYQLVPYQAHGAVDSERSYKIVTEKYRWGGADAKGRKPYMDETAGRMVTYTRMTMTQLATRLLDEATLQLEQAKDEGAKGNAAGKRQWEKKATQSLNRSAKTLDLIMTKLSPNSFPFNFSEYYAVGTDYCEIGRLTKNKKMTDKGLKVLREGMTRYSQNVKYAERLIEKFGSMKASMSGRNYTVPGTQLSPENTQILALYYEFYMAYYQYAGKEAANKLIQSLGMTSMLPRLEKYYAGEEAKSGEGAASGVDESDYSGEGLSPEDIKAEMMSAAEEVAKLQKMSAAERAALGSDYTPMDSLFYYYMLMYEDAGGSIEEISAEIAAKGVDINKAQSQFAGFVNSHPDLFQDR